MVVPPDSSASVRIRIEFIPTRSEITSVVRFRLRHRNYFGGYVGVGALLIAAGAGAWAFDSGVAAILGLAGVVDLLFVIGRFRAVVKHQVSRLQQNSVFSLRLSAPIRYELQTSELWIIEPYKLPIAWYSYVVDRKGGIILSDEKFSRTIMIPSRSFRCVGDRRRFLEILNVKAKNTGPWIWRRVQGL